MRKFSYDVSFKILDRTHPVEWYLDSIVETYRIAPGIDSVRGEIRSGIINIEGDIYTISWGEAGALRDLAFKRWMEKIDLKVSDSLYIDISHGTRSDYVEIPDSAIKDPAFHADHKIEFYGTGMSGK